MSTCGSAPIAAPEAGEAIDPMRGSSDEPGRFKSTHNYATKRFLPSRQDTSHLPGTRSDEDPSEADRWIKAVGKLPD